MDKLRLLALGLCLTVFSGAVLADSLDAQRQRYLQIKQAWDGNQMEVVQQLMPTLKDYPLYPYLEYRQLTQDLGSASVTQVSQFLQQHPTLPPAKSLSSRFVNELARREDWRSLLVFSPQEPKSAAARCNYYYAKWATGDQQAAWKGADDIWMNGQSLPASCDKLFSVWQAAGKQTPSNTLARMKLAMKEGNSSLVNALYRQLPAEYQTMGDALVRLQKDPSTVESFARNVGPTDFTRSATIIAFERFARQNAESARAMISTVARLQKMSESEKLELEEAVAWRWMGSDATFEQAQWRDQVILRSQLPALLERRVRMALGAGDRQGLKTWLSRLPEDSRDKDEWRYWRASELINDGQRSEGEAILRSLMNQRGFYPMVAAQKLNVPYPVKVAVAAKPQADLVQAPEIARVRELMYWNMDNQARNEWSAFVASRNRSEQEALARYAFEQNWADLSVQATIVAKLWDHLEERFPLAWPQEFRRTTEDKGITPSYAMAIARQESAWNPKAQSPVGAAGLMQVMPRTAQHTVERYGIPGYSNPSQLYDPKTNITIGTRYLESVYQQFGRNRILAAAAYNAGPSRVNTWLANTDGRVDAVAFVESIPFSETRSYVKNVLAYDAFYRYFMHHPAKVLTDAEWQRRY
ncbi:murein transglycosylase [Serratia sp. UGAL515B_01]|uniref:murein transglycosylase n=1 Tax=Serratia sp. UGAL515B_01 TaxID=2986763 RepID=UPI002953FBA3|nr:murein transglycosylase [Serratia sp. UGAL515B_01]WON78859.1 murein transglycosylase [Serratia sp. UGAL515B_01]